MKRLIKKAEHDILNRDAAILYINGKFYEDVTHAACLYTFLKEEGVEFETDFQTRPDYELLKELSTTYNDIVLAHHVNKENGIFILYGFINGQEVSYDNLPSNIIEDFKNQYGMDIYDDLKHEQVENLYDEEEQTQNFNKRKNELESDGNEEIIQKLLDNGFTEVSGCYNKNGITVKINKDKINVYRMVGANSNVNLDNIDRIIKDADTESGYKTIVSEYNGTITPNQKNVSKFDVSFSNEDGTLQYNFVASQGGFKLDTESLKKSNFSLYSDLRDYMEDELDTDINNSLVLPDLEELYYFS